MNARVHHDILHSSSLPPLRSFAPFLPWKNGTAIDTCTLQYASQASLLWAATTLEEASDASTQPVASSILGCEIMDRICKKLTELHFDFLTPASSWHDAVKKLRSFVAASSDPVFCLKEADLEKIDPGPLADTNALPVPNMYTRDIELG